jgi:hypothetical protein
VGKRKLNLSVDVFILNKNFLLVSLSAHDLLYIVNAYPVTRREDVIQNEY